MRWSVWKPYVVLLKQRHLNNAETIHFSGLDGRIVLIAHFRYVSPLANQGISRPHCSPGRRVVSHCFLTKKQSRLRRAYRCFGVVAAHRSRQAGCP
jgi:hypothetical protein